MTSPRERRRFALAVAGIIGLAFALRLFQLGTDSFWVDEINVLAFVRSGHLLSDLRARGGPFEPPLHYLAVWAASALPIGFEAAARVPAVLFGTLEVGALMLVTRRLTRRVDVTLLAGAFLAVAPFAVRYSQENRYYTTFSALHLLTWWLVVRSLQERTRAAFLWWGAAVGLLILSHPFAPLVVLVQLATVAWIARSAHKRGIPEQGRWLVQDAFRGLLVGLAVILPWYLWGLVQWIPDLVRGRSYSLNIAPRESVRLDFDLVKRTAEWLLGNGGRWTLLSAGLGLLVVPAFIVAQGAMRRVALAVGCYGAAFFLILVPLTHVLNTYFAMRRVEFLLPLMILLAALGVVAIADWFLDRDHGRPFRSRRALALIAATVVALSLVAVVVYYHTEKTDYRALAKVIAATPKDTEIVVGPVDRRWPEAIEHYLAWRNVHRKLRFVIAGNRAHLPVETGNPILWITGAPPGGRDFSTRALNSVPDLQVIAGDRTSPGAILPWFASTSHPTSAADLRRQFHVISHLAVFLSPPESPFPWWPFTGR